MSRRRFLLALGGLGGVAIAGTAAVIARHASEPFESRELDLGSVDEVLEEIAVAGHLEVEIRDRERILVVAWDPSYTRDGRTAASVYGDQHPVVDATTGLMALYLVSPFRGCSVRLCEAGFYEDLCHGGAYNRWGEYQHGPRTPGLGRLRIAVIDDRVVLYRNPLLHLAGQPPDETLYAQEATGPFCITP